MGESVVFAGYLRKSPPERKLTISTWHKRYFVLKENKHLAYFKNEKAKEPIKEPINLRHCKSVEAGLYHKSFKHVFSIKTSDRLYYLVADSREEMEMWVEKICKACGFTKLERNSPDISVKKKKSLSYGRSPPLPGTSPVGSVPSYLSSRMSNLSPVSPNGYCPVRSFPELGVKLRSSSDPPDILDQENIKMPVRRNMSLIPDIAHAQLSSSPLFSGNYDTVPQPRPASQDVYDVVPPPREDPSLRNSGQDYDVVPPPRPDRPGSSAGNYDRLPSPRLPTQPASGIYDIVPRPQSCGDEDTYDVPPPRHSQDANKMLSSHHTSINAGRFDSVLPGDNPNPSRMMEKQETYDVLPPPRGAVSDQETYDVVPPRGVSASNQDNYDVVPTPRGIISHQDTYDVLPSPRGVVPDQETYDVVPPRVVSASNQDNYDVVPPPRNIVLHQDMYDVLPAHRRDFPDEETYDMVLPPREVVSDQQTYDVVPPLRGVDQETYDVLPPPRPTSLDLYDIVPPPRRSSSGACDTYDTLPRPVPTSEQCGGSPSALLKDPPQEIYDVVPPPKPSPYRGNVYDVVPSPNKIVSVDWSLQSSQSSLSNQCPLNSREEGYHQPLPTVPSEESRDSGVYGSGDIYQCPTNLSGEGHEIQQNLSGNQGTPPVNRSTKPPPEVNRKSKPVSHKDHCYSNMPPPVNRCTKPRQAPPNTTQYENYPNRSMHGTSLDRNRSLPVDAPCQNNHVNTSEPASYCHMAPRRLETTRCYSFSKKPSTPEENYEEMASLHAVNRNSTSSSSSSSLCYEDDDESYTVMGVQPQNKKKKDLQYAEVQIVEGSHRHRHLQQDRPNTQYTFISEESTQALRQACHARKEHKNN